MSKDNKQSLSHQKIFFGTPGSGKSYRVDELIKGKSVYRTTFHPDSDYASFVGCYKPVSQSMENPSLSFEELEEIAKEFPSKYPNVYPIARFFAQYHKQIEQHEKKGKTEYSTKLRSIIIDNNPTKRGEPDPYGQGPHMHHGIAAAQHLEEIGMLKDSTGEISYKFIPQVFTEAYVEAWSNLDKSVYLVIEEINRGNCAQIFGDLFQLLDRDSNGYSGYPITADSDLKNYLEGKLGKDHKGIKGGKLCLPPNLHILATMNTSDQSLFPMDSAFKRRWDWEYVPIDYSEEIKSGKFIITLGDKQYRWVNYLQKVNERIRKVTASEDKQMGNFFIKGDVSEAEFKGKVMFYLWSEICKDEYGTHNNFFRSKENDKEIEFSFNDLYGTEGLKLLHGFMDYLGVEPEGKEVATEENKNEQEG